MYDRGLFRGTGHELGSDFCTGDVAEGQTSALDGGEFAQATAGYQYVKKALCAATAAASPSTASAVLLLLLFYS